MKDAAIEQLSTDRRFACYYNAALQLAHMVLAAAGYRINANKVGHHKVTLEIAGEILGDDAVVAINFFEMCRRKRHSLQYVSAGSISNAEIEQIKAQASAFRLFVEKWLSKNTNFS
ncbi:MAG: hypothetical protein KGS72_18945 [Cyanobacteria bacterium REEB67]|nr:hypothetical protein [Cyanobacteria bacterium REEB67]